MSALAEQVLAAWRSTSSIELAAVLLALAYLGLAIRQHIACWAAAFVSSALYVLVLFRAHLYMESALNVFYAAMALYGFWQWRSRRAGGALRVSRWPLGRHALALVLALYGLQVLLSNIWMKSFRYGPVEWAWRCLTYWRREPMRRKVTTGPG